MTLHGVLSDEHRRRVIAADAVAEAGAAVRERSGFSAAAAQVGLELINRLRPVCLQRHVASMLPDMALVIGPHWDLGQSTTGGRAYLEQNAEAVTSDLLAVADAYVAGASDAQAIAVYNQLRARAPRRVSEQMPRIAQFIERHTPPLT